MAMIKEGLAGNVKAYEAIAKYSGQGTGTEEDMEEQRIRTDRARRARDQEVGDTDTGDENIRSFLKAMNPCSEDIDQLFPDDEEDEDYDLSPDEDELDDMEEESDDELDTLENPRITEIEDEVPALVNKKGKNKRAAEEPAETLDEIMEKSGEKLSKKQQKKLKTNEAKAAAAPESKESPRDAKAVKFAKNLEMGPTGSEAPKAPEKKKEALGVRLVDGIKIDDKKIGTGPGATKGDRLSMRYIGKLEDGKVFDSNKSGKPFTFTLGIKEVIQGWDTGILGMKVGGERRLTIPSKAAYGSQKLPGIPANSTLIFDIKLLDIKHKGKKN